MTNVSEDLLTSYSFLAALSENESDLYKTVYTPLFQRTFSLFAKSGKTAGTDECIQELVKNEFGIDVPLLIVRKLIQVIEDASAKSFKPFFNSHIAKDAHVVTNEWNGYKPLKKEYPNLEQVRSDKGNGLLDLHLHILNIKGWLRGIHHHASKERLQGYLDEYHFRFNRRNNMDTIFDLLIKRMVNNKPRRLHSKEN